MFVLNGMRFLQHLSKGQKGEPFTHAMGFEKYKDIYIVIFV